MPETLKGYISLDIPVKPYIRAYIIHEIGECIKMSPNQHVISNKLYDLLEHKQNHQRTVSPCNYGSKIRIHMSMEIFRRRGCNLNNSNVRSFNRFVELLIKHRFHQLMDDFTELQPSFEAHLPEVRARLGIDIESWSDDSMKKDYYRYRLEKKKPLWYKTFGKIVPSERNDDVAF